MSEGFEISEDGVRILSFEKILCTRCGTAMVPVHVNFEGDRDLCLQCPACVKVGFNLQPKGNTPSEMALMMLVQVGHVLRDLHMLVRNGRFIPSEALEEVAGEDPGDAPAGN